MKIAKNIINNGYLQGIIVNPPYFSKDGKTVNISVKVKDGRKNLEEMSEDRREKNREKKRRKKARAAQARAEANNEAVINAEGEAPAEIETPAETEAPASSENAEANAQNAAVAERRTFFINCTAFDEECEALKEAKPGTLVYIQYHLSRSKRLDKDGLLTVFNNRIIDSVNVGETLSSDAQLLIPYINEGLCQGEFVDIYPTGDKEARILLKTALLGKGNKYYNQLIEFFGYGTDIINAITNHYSSGDSLCVTYKIETEKRHGQHITRYVITSLK